jgi:hypothetical protein
MMRILQIFIAVIVSHIARDICDYLRARTTKAKKIEEAQQKIDDLVADAYECGYKAALSDLIDAKTNHRRAFRKTNP